VSDGPEVGDPPEAIRTNYELTIGDLLRAAVIESLTSRVSSAVAGSLVFMGIILIVYDDPLGWFSVGLGLVVITGLYNAPFTWWAARRRADLVVGHRELVADASGIRITAPTSKVELIWDAFRSVRVRRDGLVLHHGTGLMLFIPTRSFTPAAVEGFRALAARAGKLDSSPRWPRTVVGIVIGVGITVAALLAIVNMA
jgi:YcxB-like protein